MFDDRQSQTGATQIARASFVDAIETLRDAWQVLFRNARAGIAHGDFDVRSTAIVNRSLRDGERNNSLERRVFNRVVNQINEQLLQAIQIAR